MSKKLRAGEAANPRFVPSTPITKWVSIPFDLALLEQMTDWSPPVQLKAICFNGDWQLLVRTSDPNDFWRRKDEYR